MVNEVQTHNFCRRADMGFCIGEPQRISLRVLRLFLHLPLWSLRPLSLTLSLWWKVMHQVTRLGQPQRCLLLVGGKLNLLKRWVLQRLHSLLMNQWTRSRSRIWLQLEFLLHFLLLLQLLYRMNLYLLSLILRLMYSCNRRSLLIKRFFLLHLFPLYSWGWRRHLE